VVARDRVHALGRTEAREPVRRLAQLAREGDLREIAGDRELIGRVSRRSAISASSTAGR
jgi:hypothetical protein